MSDEPVVTTTVTKETFVQKVEHGAEVAVHDVVKVATFAFTEGQKLVKIIETAEKLSPAFKSQLQTLVDDVKPVAVALAPAIASEGTNVAFDVAAVAAIVPQLAKLVKDFLSFEPLLSETFTAVEADLS